MCQPHFVKNKIPPSRKAVSLIIASLFSISAAAQTAFTEYSGNTQTITDQTISQNYDYIFSINGNGSKIIAQHISNPGYPTRFGIASIDHNGALNISDSQLTTDGVGFNLSNGSTLTLANTTLQTKEEGFHMSGGSTLDATHLTLDNTNNSGGLWFNVFMGATVTLRDSHLSSSNANGLYGFGIDATGNAEPFVINISNTDMQITGNLSAAIFPISMGIPQSGNIDLALTDSHIVMQGDNNNAFKIVGQKSNLIVNGGTASSNGRFSHTMELINAAPATLNSTLLSATGEGSSALHTGYFSNSLFVNTLTANNTRLTAQDAPVVTAAANLDLNLNNGSQLDAQNGHPAILATSSAIQIFGNVVTNDVSNIVVNANASVINGDAVLDNTNFDGSPGNGSLTMNINNGAVWTGAAQAVTSVNLNSGVWNVTGDSTVGTLDNHGTVAFTTPSGGIFKTLTVSGNYSAGSALMMNVALGGDDSPSDKLIIQGDSGGSTAVTVNNIGGNGAPTTNGIEIIHVNGVSNGLFSLTGRVSAGAFDYTLNQNSPGSWTLNSSLANIRPEAGAYLSNYVSTTAMFMHRLNDRHYALADRTISGSNNNPTSGGDNRGVWMRATGWQTDSTAAKNRIHQRTDVSVVQFGMDAFESISGDNRFVAGLMAGYGRSDTDSRTRSTSITSNSTVDGYSIGAYATWYGHADQLTGPYVDIWTQYGWYDNKVHGQQSQRESYNSDNWALSVEGGYAFPVGQLNGQLLTIEPQLQAGYLYTNVEDHRDDNNVLVHGGSNDNFFGRAGVRLETQGMILRPFLEANWLYGDIANTLRYGDLSIQDDTPDNRYEIRLGASGRIGHAWELWGSVGGQWGENHYSSFSGELGARYTW